MNLETTTFIHSYNFVKSWVPTLYSILQVLMAPSRLLRCTFSTPHTKLSPNLRSDCLFHACLSLRWLSLPSLSDQYHLEFWRAKKSLINSRSFLANAIANAVVPSSVSGSFISFNPVKYSTISKFPEQQKLWSSVWCPVNDEVKWLIFCE